MSNVSPPSDSQAPCPVLVVSSHPGLRAQARRLHPHVSAGEVAAHDLQLTSTVCAFDYSAVETVARARQQGKPFAVAVLDVQPGTEAMTEQLTRALFHADVHLQILLITAPGTAIGRAWMSGLGQGQRVGWFQGPCDDQTLAQWVHILASKWAGESRTTPLPHAAAGAPPQMDELAAQSQTVTLEAMGGLALGIAHEFNNILTVIQTQLDLAIQEARGNGGVLRTLEQAMRSARDATALSRKLAAFNPASPGQPGAADVTALVDEEVSLLRRTLGEHLCLETDHEDVLPEIWVDPVVLSQVIVNTAIHARGAMPQGGVLQFSTRSVNLAKDSPEARRFPHSREGAYVLLSVENPHPAQVPTIPGIHDEERLAWLERVLHAHGGGFACTLAPGVMHAYHILLPLAAAHEEPVEVADSARHAFEGQEAAPATILVVDDDEAICLIMSQVLTTRKHQVITAHNADEGWRRWCQYRHSIGILVTDINMPGGANGVALAEAIHNDDRSLPVIYTSGHRAAYQFTDLTVGMNYLPKPFGMMDLIQVVESSLARHRTNRRALPPSPVLVSEAA